MKTQISKIFLHAILTCISVEVTTAASCTNRSLAINKIQWKLSYKQRIDVLSNGTIKHYTKINWTFSGAEESELDGFLLRMDDDQGHIIDPYADSEASSTRAWIKTDNERDCEVSNETEGSGFENSLLSEDHFCTCNVKECPVLKGLSCSPVVRLRMKVNEKFKSLGRYRSIPSSRRSITYETKYNTAYTLNIYPYRRQYGGRRATLPILKNISCVNDLMNALNISLADANYKCCVEGQPNLSPLDFQRTAITLDKVTNTLNVTLSWVPPISTPTFEKSSYTIYRLPFSSDQPKGTDITGEGMTGNNGTCSMELAREQVTFFDLRPNATYYVIITAAHEDSERNYGAAYSKTLSFFTGYCQSKCVENMTTCSYDSVTSVTTCVCPSGLFGDGISREYNGSGCASCHEMAGCHFKAKCSTTDAPGRSFHCQCENGYDGDGLRLGSGCQKIAIVSSTIIVVSSLFGVLVVLLIIFGCLCMRKSKSKPVL